MRLFFGSDAAKVRRNISIRNKIIPQTTERQVNTSQNKFRQVSTSKWQASTSIEATLCANIRLKLSTNDKKNTSRNKSSTSFDKWMTSCDKWMTSCDKFRQVSDKRRQASKRHYEPLYASAIHHIVGSHPTFWLCLSPPRSEMLEQTRLSIRSFVGFALSNCLLLCCLS